MSRRVTWEKFLDGLPEREREQAGRELERAREENPDDLDLACRVAACRVLEGMGFHENDAIRFAAEISA